MSGNIPQVGEKILKPILLVVHNDTQIVRQIAKMTSELADVLYARDLSRATLMASSHPGLSAAIVGTVDGGAGAIDVLGMIESKCHSARRIMMADPTDLMSSIAALHSGVVDHILPRPLRERELTALLALPTRGIAAARATSASMAMPATRRTG